MFALADEKCVIDDVLVVEGKVESDSYSGKARVVADNVSNLREVRHAHVKRLLLKMLDRAQTESLIAQLPFLMKPFCSGGTCPVFIDYQGEEARAELALGDQWRVQLGSDLIKQLRHCCGTDCVLLEYR